MNPEPLSIGAVLAERYEIERVLGRGGFGIAYLCSDRATRRKAVLKELAPTNVMRRNGALELEALGTEVALSLRRRFLEEAALLQKLESPGIVKLRSSFVENGTAYFATDYLPDCTTLADLLAERGQLAARHAEILFRQLLETLEAVHYKRILHRDIKPSNVLLGPQHRAHLIDFGAAREWHFEAPQTQTMMFTPSYAAPEQLSPRARRGPATDLYGLCATMYEALAGEPPPAAPDRISGVRLIPLSELRLDVEPDFERAILWGLELRYDDRPQSAAELLAPQTPGAASAGSSLEELDAISARLSGFRFARKACPVCEGLLQEARPLRRNVCPVCRSGVIRSRNLVEHLCPVCRGGKLTARFSGKRLVPCPACCSGLLEYSPGLLRKSAKCSDCGSSFDVRDGFLRPAGEEAWQPIADLLAESGRSSEILVCGCCQAQFDACPDGRYRQVVPRPKGRHSCLFPDEWARVAANLDPGAGNAECNDCGADYFIEAGSVTVLGSHEDPFGFVEAYAGRRLTPEDVRWLGAGKTSPVPGLVCQSCDLELDRDGEYLRIVRTSDRRLRAVAGRPMTLEDIQRVATGLPEVADEDSHFERLHEAARNAFRTGQIPGERSGGEFWRGRARLEGEGGPSSLSVSPAQLSVGGMLRKWRLPLDAITDCAAEGQSLTLQISGQREPVELWIEPMELTLSLRSGDVSIEIGARDLEARIRHELRR